MAPSPDEPERKTSDQTRTVLALFLLSILYVSETSLFPVLVVDLDSRLSCRDTAPSAWGSTFGYGMAIGIAVSVGLRLLIGEPRTVLAGLATMAVSLTVLSGIGSCDLALDLRLLQGFGAGLFAPLVPVLLNAFDGDLHDALLAKWSAVTGITAAFSPLLATLLSQSMGAQSVLAVLALLAFAALLMLLPFGGERHVAAPRDDDARETPRWAGLLSIFACVALTFGFATWVLYAMATVALELGIGADVLGIGVMLAWISSSGASLLVSKLPPASYRSLLTVSVLIAVLSYATLVWGTGTFHFFMAACLAGLGMGFANVPSTVCAFRITPRRLHGLISALDIFCARLGGALFISVLG